MTDISTTAPKALTLKSKEGREAWVAKLTADSLAAVLPRHLTAETFAKVVGAEFVRNPDLADCTPSSLALCLITAAQHGLAPSGPLGHAYLIPRKKGDTKECTLLIGYKGLCELARRTGEIARMDARVVYEGEAFDVTAGSDPKIEHRPSLTVARTDDKIVAAYAVVVTKDGGTFFDFVTRSEIDARRARGGSRSYSPWTTDYAAMARKSALRKLLMGGIVPISAELASAIDREDREDGVYETATAPRRSVASILDRSDVEIPSTEVEHVETIDAVESK